MINIRPASPEDFEGIAEAELSAGQLFEGTHMAWAVGETTAQARLATAVDEDFLWVAEIDGQIAGFLMGGRCGSNFHIYEAATHQNYRGRRIGSELIGFAIKKANQRGFTRASLTTDRSLPWNAPYYAKLGFQVVIDPSLDLAEILATEHNPHLRCAMEKEIMTPELADFA